MIQISYERELNLL